MGGIGLDLGSRTIRYVRLSAGDREGRPRLDRIIIADAPALAAPAGEAASSFPGPEGLLALRRELLAARERPGTARLGIDARSFIVQYVQVPVVPPWRLKLIMNYEIQELAARMMEPIATDYRLVQAPSRGSDRILVLVAFAKDAQVEPRIDALEAQGIRVKGLAPNAIAVYNAYRCLGLGREGRTSALVDIGHSEVQVAIEKDGLLIFARGAPLPTGQAIERVAADLGCSEADALRYLAEGPPRGKEDDFQQALRPVFQPIVSIIQSSFRFFAAQTKLPGEVDEVWLSGGGASIVGLAEHLSGKLGVPTKIFDPLEHLDASALLPAERSLIEGRGPSLAAAVGLALMDAGRDPFTLEILPARFRRRREFRERTVFLYIAAAVLLVYLLLALGEAYMRRGDLLARNMELHDQLDGLNDRDAELDRIRSENDVRRGVLQNLAGRSETGFSLALVLDRLRGALPESVSLREIRVETPESPAGTGDPAPGGQAAPLADPRGVTIRLDGEVDNASGDGHRIIRQVESALRTIHEVATAETDPQSLVENRAESFIRFTMRVVVAPPAP